jgi:uncharacterized membrane protein
MQKYIPGIFFGVFCAVMCYVNPSLFLRSPLAKLSPFYLVIVSVVTGILAGLLLIGLGKLFKANKTSV